MLFFLATVLLPSSTCGFFFTSLVHLYKRAIFVKKNVISLISRSLARHFAAKFCSFSDAISTSVKSAAMKATNIDGRWYPVPLRDDASMCVAGQAAVPLGPRFSSRRHWASSDHALRFHSARYVTLSCGKCISFSQARVHLCTVNWSCLQLSPPPFITLAVSCLRRPQIFSITHLWTFFAYYNLIFS